MADQTDFTASLTGLNLGRFQVHERLASEGQATVYLALDRERGAQCTLTVIGFGSEVAHAARETILSRSQRLMALDHPGIVGYQAAGIEGKYLYLLGPLVESPTLADRLAESPFGIEQASRCLRQISQALAFAHGRGITVHLLRPDFIYTDPDGGVRLAHLGLGYLAGNFPSTEGGVGLSSGLARGENMSARMDVYALGVLLFRLLTGYTTANTSRPIGEIIQLFNERMALRKTSHRQIPEGVQAVILKAVSPTAAERYGSVMELYAAFQEAAAPILEAHLRLRQPEVEPVKPASPVKGRGETGQRIRRFSWVLLAVLAIAGSGVILASAGFIDLPVLRSAGETPDTDRVQLTAMAATIEALTTRVHGGETDPELLPGASAATEELHPSEPAVIASPPGPQTPGRTGSALPGEVPTLGPASTSTANPPGATQPPAPTGVSPGFTTSPPVGTSPPPESTSPPPTTAAPTQTVPAPTNTSPPATSTPRPPTSTPLPTPTAAPPTNTPILPLPTLPTLLP